MGKTEFLRDKINEFGLEQIGKVLRMSTTELVRYSDYPVDNPIIMFDILSDLYQDIHKRPGGYLQYKEFSIKYEDGLLVWNNGVYVENNGGGVSFEFYATPFFNNESIVPIALNGVWVDNIDGDTMDINDEIYDDYDSYDVDYKQLDSVDKLIEWFRTIYLSKTYRHINKLMSVIIKNNKL